MPSTYHSLNIHYIFSTRERRALITPDLQERVRSFMGGILTANEMKPLSIGGPADHVHILTRLPTTMPVSKGIQLVKGGSSKWVSDTFGHLATFRWQEGCAAFSVSVSQIQETIKYIENQERHHRGKSFKEEYLSFLEKHGIPYDERYLWE